MQRSQLKMRADYLDLDSLSLLQRRNELLDEEQRRFMTMPNVFDTKLDEYAQSLSNEILEETSRSLELARLWIRSVLTHAELADYDEPKDENVRFLRGISFDI